MHQPRCLGQLLSETTETRSYLGFEGWLPTRLGNHEMNLECDVVHNHWGKSVMNAERGGKAKINLGLYINCDVLLKYHRLT